MAEFLDQVSDFYSHTLDQSLSSNRYLLLDPGGDHQYYFIPKSKNLKEVSRMIDGKGFKRRLGAMGLSACSIAPNTATLLPYVSSRRVTVGEETRPDLIVVSNRIRLLDRTGQTVHTLPRSASKGVKKEIQARLSLPDEIKTPQLLDWSLEVPYFSETYVNGKPLGSPTENWKKFECVYKQLRHLYRDDIGDLVSIEKYIDRILMELSDLDVRPDLLKAADDILDQLSLPTHVRECCIHGDMHGRNVLLDQNELYIIDWENLRSDLLIMDFFRPFLVDYYDTRNIKLFLDMFDPNSMRYAHAQSFAEITGEIMWEDDSWYPGLILLAALKSLDRNTQHSPMWNCALDLLNELVEYEPK